MAKAKTALLERNPVLLSLDILKEMGMTEEHYKTFQAGDWARIWSSLVALRDSLPPEKWTTELLKLMANPPDKLPPYLKGNEAWPILDHALNIVYTRANP
jgi:hypothetical protein